MSDGNPVRLQHLIESLPIEPHEDIVAHPHNRHSWRVRLLHFGGRTLVSFHVPILKRDVAAVQVLLQPTAVGTGGTGIRNDFGKHDSLPITEYAFNTYIPEPSLGGHR